MPTKYLFPCRPTGKNLLLLLIIASICGCAKLRNYFPDKIRNYQKAATITPLRLPPGLTMHAMDRQTGKQLDDKTATITVTTPPAPTPIDTSQPNTQQPL